MTEKKLKKIMIARFPYGNEECPDVADFLVRTVLAIKEHPLLDDEVINLKYDDTPITMTRNKALEDAKKVGADFLLMIDSDMKCDVHLGDLAGSKPFFRSSIDFMLSRYDRGPCLVAAPYCGPPPDQFVYVFRWVSGFNRGETPEPGFKLDMIPRNEAAQWKGMMEVAALPTGLILIDMRALKASKLKPPYFDYTYTDETRSVKDTTEDVYFTRNCSLAGVPCYCNWDAWAGHWKRWLAVRPQPWFVNHIQEDMVEAVRANITDKQALRQVIMKDGKMVDCDLPGVPSPAGQNHDSQHGELRDAEWTVDASGQLGLGEYLPAGAD